MAGSLILKNWNTTKCTRYLASRTETGTNNRNMSQFTGFGLKKKIEEMNVRNTAIHDNVLGNHSCRTNNEQTRIQQLSYNHPTY
jgi:hypothetical protein